MLACAANYNKFSQLLSGIVLAPAAVNLKELPKTRTKFRRHRYGVHGMGSRIEGTHIAG